MQMVSIIIDSGGGGGGLFCHLNQSCREFHEMHRFTKNVSQVQFRGGGGLGGGLNITSTTFGTFLFEPLCNVCLHITCDDIITGMPAHIFHVWYVEKRYVC